MWFPSCSQQHSYVHIRLGFICIQFSSFTPFLMKCGQQKPVRAPEVTNRSSNQVNTWAILECNCSLVLSVSWHMILHMSSTLRYQCSVCRPSYKALLHVGTQQERVDQPWFDQLLVVGCLDAVWTPYCEPPQGSLETHTHFSIHVQQAHRHMHLHISRSHCTPVCKNTH